MLPALAHQASEQSEAFTFAQAVAAGYSAAEVRGRVRSGNWVRLAHGGYAAAAALPDAAAHHRARAAALVLTGAGAAVSHRSAAVMLGLERIGDDRGPVHLLRASGGQAAASVRLHRAAWTPEELIGVNRIPVTAPVRTVMDVAATESFRDAVVIADSALARGLITPTQLATASRRHAVRRVCEFADGRAENPGESLSRVGIHAAGLPAPELQVELVVADGGRGIRIDFLWRRQRVVGEFDGRLKYQDRDDLWREKVREDRIRAMGFLVVRWGWREAFEDFAPTARRIRQALALADAA